MIFQKINFFLRIILNLEFTIPKSKNFLIFDSLKLNYLKFYIGESINVINFRDKEFSFFAFIYASVFFFRSEFKVEYINFFLNFTKKKTIISFNYNRLILYKIKKYYPSVKIIVIQNGVTNQKFIDKLKNNRANLSCDYFLCMSKIEKKKIKKHINSKFIVIGSFLNNFYNKFKPIEKQEILLISQFRDKISNVDLQASYSNTLKFLIPCLIKFFKKKKLKVISILGTSSNYNKEKQYYKNFFKENKFNFYKKNKFLGYERVNHASMVIGIDSTLLYEAFSRNKKIGIFNLSGNIKKFREHDTFLWKSYLKGEGVFWTRSKNQKRIYEILNFLNKSTQSEWLKKKSKYKDLLALDNNNKKFMNIINTIV